MRIKALLLAALLSGFAGSGWGALKVLPFESPQEEKRFNALIAELRCLVCQNQSLADSNAELAQDLRDLVFKKMREGKSDKEIIDFLVARYSDFVLYRPPFKTSTALLWTLPFLLLAGGATVAYFVARRHRREPEPQLSPEEYNKVAKLLDSDKSTEPPK